MPRGGRPHLALRGPKRREFDIPCEIGSRQLPCVEQGRHSPEGASWTAREGRCWRYPTARGYPKKRFSRGEQPGGARKSSPCPASQAPRLHGRRSRQAPATASAVPGRTRPGGMPCHWTRSKRLTGHLEHVPKRLGSYCHYPSPERITVDKIERPSTENVIFILSKRLNSNSSGPGPSASSDSRPSGETRLERILSACSKPSECLPLQFP